MDYRQLMRAVAAGRIVVGAGLVVLPGFAGRQWIGPAANDGAVKVLARALGIRDLALGAGTLHALDAGEPARSWVALGAISDAVDLAATALAIRAIGPRRALPLMVTAAAAATAGLLAVDQVD